MTRSFLRSCACASAALFLLSSGPARADWVETSSDHFVIYGDQAAEVVRSFAERLELFHAAMSKLLQSQQAKPSPSNRVTIFSVETEAQVREIVGDGNAFLAGYYDSRAGGSYALVPRLKSASKIQRDLASETILYHEYSHHFMAGMTSRSFPRWFVEGFAEFYAGVRFKQDGTVLLGTPANHRAYELAYSREVPIRTLLEFDGGRSQPSKTYDSFYGQSWALFHYMFFEPARAGQLKKYQTLLATGDTALEAAEGAFGDLDQLDRDIERYIRRSRLGAFGIKRSDLVIGPISVRTLRPGEAAMMPTFIRSKRGVTREQALALVPDARKVAERYPQDPAVQAALAEAEFDAGNDDAAIAAADRALALEPNRVNAYIQKGYALRHKIEEGKLPKASWKDVRSQFVKANKLENDHPVPLINFYLSFIDQGQEPSKVAVQGLEWSMVLAPFDPTLRWLVAQQMIHDERWAEAARTLAPLAYSPHPGEHTDQALQLLKEVEAKAHPDAVADAELKSAP
jgi:tetratricopeptide (TPR) repeat protein